MSIRHKNFKRALTTSMLIATIGTCFGNSSLSDQAKPRIHSKHNVRQEAVSHTPENLDRRNRDFEVSTYIDSINQKISRFVFSLPKSDLRDYADKPILLTLVIDEDGVLLDAYPKNGQGDTNSAEFAIKAVNLAGPYPAPPSTIIKLRKSVQFTIMFRITKGKIEEK